MNRQHVTYPRAVPPDLTGTPPDLAEDGRVCAEEDCDTILCRFNLTDRCWQCGGWVQIREENAAVESAAALSSLMEQPGVSSTSMPARRARRARDARWAELQRRWNAGQSSDSIAEAMGTTCVALRTTVSRMRREGYEMLYRRRPISPATPIAA
jgi:hypothetical protein